VNDWFTTTLTQCDWLEFILKQLGCIIYTRNILKHILLLCSYINI